MTGKAVLTTLLRHHAVLCLTYSKGYTIEPGGQYVAKRIAQSLIAESRSLEKKPGPRLVANGDGLFPDMDQTWRAEL